MSFSKQKLSLEEARQIDIIDYLSAVGHDPTKIRGYDYWYLSPLREEKTASFKVNRKLNVWYDHGLGKGGNFIDFAILYNNCTIGKLLRQLNDDVSFHPHFTDSKKEAIDEIKNRIVIVKEKELTSFSLLRYLQKRRISFDIAHQYCREVHYRLNDKKYYGIGFKNNSGGFEIRTPYCKVSSSPKDFTTFDNGAKEVSVFEGFIDFLSYLIIQKNQSDTCRDFVILNSLSFFEKARQFLEEHEQIKLFLDRDNAGQNCSKYALSLDTKYRDKSSLYEHCKDLNDWLMNFGKLQKIGMKIQCNIL